ncbi:strawberry notch C-terminal domain-containing protein, partial [Rhodoferax sp.]|uniref:strawberry notch C-terminal domain-containing protein n=1 Tax=Rhodoferax sp. TaxID=50421 RepID=UPI0025EC3A42
MAQPIQDALSKLEDEVGDIDEFARSELGYATVADLHHALMGLQVDSVAMSIHQIKKGKAVVIADQTGIGKGRQAASIIRWAARQGFTPVFVSVKPSLFTDMYGDLADIGTHDVQPFIMNGDAWVAGEDGTKLFANKPAGHKNTIQRIADTGQLPEGRNAVFMTYSQINVDNVQRKALMALASNAVFVLDESHNAAGASATGDFVIGALDAAKGVTYLSATYAKRPDNMPLYFKTDIGDAAADADGLAVAMSSGGLPLQTVVSNNLVKAGQMFRRERSYDGVSILSKYDTPHRALHERMSDEATKALRAIVSADSQFHEGYVKMLKEELAALGSTVQDSAGNQLEAGVQHTEFSSVVHNFVKQMLLGLKAQAAADDAIESLRRGEKPIIAVENTMGSFLTEYAAAHNIGQGDSLGSFDYRTVLTRALARSRVIIEVGPTGDKVKRPVPLSELDAGTRAAYDEAQKVIDGLTLDIPVSPIDWMRAEITRAGYQVAEITGRSLSVDYSDPKKPVLAAIDLLEQKDKVNTTRQFNAGKLDALILNVAGSTGISLHASEKFEDQRQRHMIVAQAAGDINIFMQMLGRVHRTGQVRLPKYTILSVDLPTEKRPTAVLSIKMKSLNANTSSNTESATSVKSADILNKYGDQIVNQYLQDNAKLARELGLWGEVGQEVQEDIARKATGRLALQPIEVQHAFYDEVESQYAALIDYLNKTNQNDLEPRTFDFDAKETRQEVLFDGPNKDTPFGEDAIYGEYSIKAQGTPMTPAEIQAAMAESLGDKTPAKHVDELLEQMDDQYKQFVGKLAEASRAAAALAAGEYDSTKHDAIGDTLNLNKIIEAAGVTRQIGIEFLRSHAIGKTFRIDINSEPFNAVVTNIRSTHKATGNPYSMSKIQVTVAVNGALRSVSVPATQFHKIEVSSIAPTFRVETLFKEQPPNQRETAKIVTGNLLAAYGELQGVRGTIISFTKQDGTSEQGILLPKLFDFTKNTRGDYRLPDGAAALAFLQKSQDKDIGRFGIMSRDGLLRVLPSGQGVRVQVPKSKLKGAKYFLDKGLIASAGDFVSSGGFMVATVYEPAGAVKVLDLLMKKQALYALPSMADEAKRMVGDKGANDIDRFRSAPAANGPAPIYSSADSTLPARPLSLNRVNQLVQEALSGIRGAPPVEVTARPGDIGLRVPAGSVGYGVTLRSGDIYVFQSAMGSDMDVFRTVFHELFHRGVRVLVPKAQYVQTMLDLAKG